MLRRQKFEHFTQIYSILFIFCISFVPHSHSKYSVNYCILNISWFLSFPATAYTQQIAFCNFPVFKKYTISQAWWLTLLIPALRGWERRINHKFKASLSHRHLASKTRKAAKYKVDSSFELDCWHICI